MTITLLGRTRVRQVQVQGTFEVPCTLRAVTAPSGKGKMMFSIDLVS
jgi:hypothetical protein